MKRYILTIIIAAYGVCCHALPAEPDSLSRGRSYYDMAEEVLSMERYDYDGVLKLGHAAYSLLLEDKDLKGASDVMVLMSDVCHGSGYQVLPAMHGSRLHKRQ